MLAKYLPCFVSHTLHRKVYELLTEYFESHITLQGIWVTHRVLWVTQYTARYMSYSLRFVCHTLHCKVYELLTEYCEPHIMAHLWLSWHLTFIDASIALLDVSYVQGPRLSASLVPGAEPPVGYERRPVNCQDVRVPLAKPRNLQRKGKELEELFICLGQMVNW